MSDEGDNRKVALLRLAKSEQALHDAKLMIQFDSLFSAVNRLYYSCFYMITALLSIDGNFPKTHSGVKSQFNQVYIKTGFIDVSHSETFSFLLNRKQDNDYNDLDTMDQEEIMFLLERAELFVTEIRFFIADKLKQ